MKNRPPKKKQPVSKDSSRFSSSESDISFETLMENFGVKPLEKKNISDKSKIKQVDSEPIEFLINQEFQLGPDVCNEKFIGRDKQPKQKKHRKIKITRNFQPDAIMDLHGETREIAVQKVESLLEASIIKGYHSILVITGRGLNSETEGGILRNIIWKWLNENQKERKFSFRWAPSFLGGKGAILIFLQSN